jgi:transposase-like protein
MGKARFRDDFKRAAVRQMAERDCPVAEFSHRLRVSQHSLSEWRKFRVEQDVLKACGASG